MPCTRSSGLLMRFSSRLPREDSLDPLGKQVERLLSAHQIDANGASHALSRSIVASGRTTGTPGLITVLPPATTARNGSMAVSSLALANGFMGRVASMAK